MSKSFDGTVQIVVASLQGAEDSVSQIGGQNVAEYIHEVYNALSSIEQAEALKSTHRTDSVTMPD